MYLDYAELQAKCKKPTYKDNWIDKLNAFFNFNEQEILEDVGKIKKEVANKLAITEYEKYHQHFHRIPYNVAS